MHDPASELRRIPLPGTGVKIVSAAAHFHGIGVARQGPWLTWVNKALPQPKRQTSAAQNMGMSGVIEEGI